MSKRENSDFLVLVADDSRYIRVIFRSFLENEGYKVVEAENGIHAIKVFQETKPDLILMDNVMPKMDGITACSMLRDLPNGKRVPIIIVTSNNDEKYVDKAFEVGATDYISKPVNWAVLRQRVRRLLHARDTEISLDKSEAFAQSIIKNALDGIITIDTEGIIHSFNPAAKQVFGYDSKDIIGENITILIPELLFRDKSYQKKLGTTMELIGLKMNGSTLPLEVTFSQFNYHEKVLFTIIIRDITERKNYEKTIQHQAFHDALTNLPNRLLLKDRLNMEIAHSKKYKSEFAVMYLDLDRFKVINDTLGHSIGDELLKIVANRLVECVSENDTVARMGGDEFAILVTGIKNADIAIKTSLKILKSLELPFKILSHKLFITASIGIAIYPSDGEEVDVLLKNADLAMYKAKENGKNTTYLYKASLNEKATKRLKMENSLRRALEYQEFELYYQPKIKSLDKKIVGMEALIRWHHPELGIVSPADFIPLAEETGLIVPIGEWVLCTACTQTKKWHDEGFFPLYIAVNLSARQFELQNLSQMIMRVLEETRLDPKWLELEITESVAMKDVEYTLKVMLKLKEMGIQFAIDDFGTGYSSLSYLKRFSLNKIKIDRTFVNEVTSEKVASPIASTIIDLGKSLQLSVVAEGVENELQFNFLRDNHCDEMQGYLFGKPMPAEQFKKLLEENF